VNGTVSADTIHTVNVVQATLIKCKPQKIIVKQNGVFCVRI